MIRGIFHPIAEKVDQALADKREKQRRSGYWVSCPGCGRRVVGKELRKKGCYVCGWREEVVSRDPPCARPASGTAGPAREPARPWRMACPDCGGTVVREHWERHGCYVCGKGPGRETP